jgi:ACS family pantothenate transporter-like MFS transporter
VKNPKQQKNFGRDVFKRVAGRWHWYLFSLLWVFGGLNESFSTNSLLAIYLKYFNYSVADRNHFPMGTYAVGIVSTFGAALFVDHTGGRYHWIVAICISVFMLVASILILANPYSIALQLTGQYLGGIAYAGQASFFAWANLVTRDDLQERAIVIASMNMFGGAVNAWWSLIFFNVSTAPEFKRGCYSMIATTVATSFIAGLIRYLQLRDNKYKSKASVELELVEVSDGDLSECSESGAQVHEKPEL